jgi:uncharacterized protein with PIN domain
VRTAADPEPDDTMETPTPAFLVDENVASLARRLRWLGYDAITDPQADDGGLVARAEREDRVLLTRDRGILLRRPIAAGTVRALWLWSDDPWQQLAQVVRELEIDAERHAFSRCVRCNVPLEVTTPAAAAAVVPAFVLETQRQFTYCPGCGRYFWRGTHWSRMRRYLEAHLRPVPVSARPPASDPTAPSTARPAI